MSPADASLLSDAVLQTKPFFRTRPEDSAILSESTGSAEAGTKSVRDRFLAQMIPARTLPVGSRPSRAFIAKRNIDMQTEFKNGWPNGRDYQNWRHSDVREVAYPYIYKLFDTIVKDGGLQP